MVQAALEGYGRAAAESAEPAPVTSSPHNCEGSLEARAAACLVPAAAVGIGHAALARRRGWWVRCCMFSFRQGFELQD